jgi:hypothetical protein
MAHDGGGMVRVRSIDPIQPRPFFRPGTLYPTDYAIVPTSDVIIVLKEGTGPLAEETEAEHRDTIDCIRYAGAGH